MRAIVTVSSLMLFLIVSAPLFAGSSYVTLYDDSHFEDRNITYSANTSTAINDLKHIVAGGQKGLNDKVSSVKHNIPSGIVCYLYEHANYQGRKFPLRGQGSIPDLGFFGDRASSFRCENDRGIKYD